MKPEETKQHFERIRKDALEEDSRSLRAALKLLAEELNTKETHFILELLQNAEDNEYGDKQPELSLRIETGDPTNTPSSDGCLVVLNNELGFQPENVRSLCSVGQSTKKNRENGYIGEKGIGFKSVFRVTDSPHIFSNGFQFRFQVPTESESFGYILPHWVKDVPTGVGEGFTAIFLPLQPGKQELISRQLSRIAPETILFLRKVKRLEVGEGHSILRDDRERSLVTLHSLGEDSLYFVHGERFDIPQDLTEEKRAGISQREVTIAFPLKNSTGCNGRIFAFLPTEFDSGLPFLVNADFILNSNRESVLEDRHWNLWLRDEIAQAFVRAFLSLLQNADWRTESHRFLPELAAVADFIRPVVESIQGQLQSKPCVLTDASDPELPANVFVPGSLARRILLDAPKERLKFALIHPSWESRWQERLKPLGVQSLTFDQVFEACNDDSWLKSRDAEWWESLFELCTKCEVSAATIGAFPILRCRDGICRPLSCGVFSNAEDQPTLKGIPSDWPAAHLLDADLQKRLQHTPAVWAWLTKVASLRPFSVRSYITGPLLAWTPGQNGERLIEVTRFIAANLKHLGKHLQVTDFRQRLRNNGVQKILRSKLPWLLADGRVLFPEQRAGKELVTPECLEGDTGWNLLFCALDRHFFVVHDDYCAGLSGDSLAEIREVFKACGATAFPDPRLREMNPGAPHYNEALARCAHAVNGTPKLRDWAAPGWLLGLENVEQTANGQRKVEALERWLKAFKPDFTQKYLHCSKPDLQGDWQQANAWSEFGDALHEKPWLRTSNGCVAPPTAFLDTSEFREFFGDSVAYNATDIAAPLLETLGVRVHLTADVLIGLLRQMAASENPDLASLAKIYRRLRDSTFDVNLFHREKLIFLSKPKPRWLSAEKLVWDDAGELFDDDFGYVSLTYDKSELQRFFTETLEIPVRPKLRHYATAWKNLWLAASPDRQTVERKLKIILHRLADSQNEFSDSDWWRELEPQLQLWTDCEKFCPPARVYVPDHSTAVDLFTGLIHVAFPPKPSRTVLAFLRSLLCRSLADAVQTNLVGVEGECARHTPVFLTPAAKELCVLLVCSHQGWERRCPHLQALLETAEVGVKEITVEYRLNDSHELGTRPLPRDAHWDVAGRRLLLRDGVDEESLRDAAAQSIAAELFGEATSAEVQSEFFRVLTVALERAQKLMRGRNNWRLSPQQQAWLREQRWKILITELDEVEHPPASRKSTGPMPQNTTAPQSAAASSQPNSGITTATAQGTGSAPNQTAPTAPGGQSQEVPRSNRLTASQGAAPETPPDSDAVTELHDATTTRAEFVEVRAYSRSRPERPRGEQRDTGRQDAKSGLSTATPESKAALEQKAREFAATELIEMGYEVEQMGPQNPGFDLRALKPGEVLKIEIKSHARLASSVFLTQREWEEYLRTRKMHGVTWELWNVEKLAESSGIQPTIQRIRHIPKSSMKESGYWVDLNQCPQEAS
jgi:hypothetical protein